MASTKDKLHGLYAITDQQLISEETFAQTIEAALRGDTRIIQYRDKSDNKKKRKHQASTVRSLCAQYEALCIINDDINLAIEVGAHGVHLGKDDTDLITARRSLGDDSIIGISCYNDIDRAVHAEHHSADYVAFGTMFPSTSKPEAVCATPEILKQAKQLLSLPICAIGGISTSNIQQITSQGADMVAVISSLFDADDVQLTAQLLSQAFDIIKPDQNVC